jgi:head-tail adaptor
MTASGKRDRKITFMRRIAVENELGTDDEVWSFLTYAWAKVLFGTGSERRDAGAAGGLQPATFRVMSTASLRGVTSADRIEFMGRQWGITSVAPVGPQGSEIEFTATMQDI